MVFTTPTALTARILGRSLSAGPTGGRVDYVGVVCLALLLKRSLSPYYVLNIADPEVACTGVIEMTNLTSTDETAGRHLVYVPKYAPPGDPLYDLPPEELKLVPQVPASLDAALAALEDDHEFLLAGGVFTKDLLDTWVDYKRVNEIDAIRLRPHPWEFAMYFDI